MKPYMFRNNRSRLLITLATVCAILLLGIASPAPALDRGAVSFQSGKIPVGARHASPLQASSSADASYAGYKHNSPGREANDPTENHSHENDNAAVAKNSVPGWQAAGRTAPFTAGSDSDPRASSESTVPTDESHNMSLLANLPRSGTNSDLAFWGNLAVAGNYNGFRLINIADPSNPQILSTVTCRGPQDDVSLWGNLLFLSVDRPQTAVGCSGDAPNPNDPSTFEGVRIFNISNPADPQFVTGIPTDCGSHTHTLIPDLAHNRVLLYVSSYYTGTGPHCGPGREADGRHKEISIVSVPLDAPEQAVVIATPEINADVFGGLGTATIGCHDITVFLDLHLAAAACMSEGQIWDITDPANPQTLTPIARIHNSAFSFWHSATFSWDGRNVIFSDETFSNGCTSPTDTNGRMWIYQNSPPYTLLNSFVEPRPPSGSEYCSAHLYNILPATDGTKLFASSWYEGGVDLVNFDDPSALQEEAFYHARTPISADTWSAYWYNGYVYAGDIARGFDVFSYTTNAPHEYVQLPYMNPQTQEHLIGSPNPTPTPEPCNISFSDVNPNDYFYEAVRYLYCAGAISGYSDGTFRPYNNTTRAQLSKIVVLAEGWPIDTTGGPHFTDVPEGSTFYDYIETAYNRSIISGYQDGSFRPNNNVTRAQLSKIIVQAQQWPIDTTGGPHFTDVAVGSPFYGFIETAYNHGIISGYQDGTFRPDNSATRGQISKIVYSTITAP